MAYILIKGELKPEKAYLVLFWFDTLPVTAKKCANMIRNYYFGRAS